MKTQTRSMILAVAATLSSAAWAADINVLTAWYGQSCGAQHGNVTLHLKSRCDGRPVCQYLVDANVIGDAAPGCAKNFVVLFNCRGQPEVRLSQLPAEASGQMLLLSCAPEAAPVRRGPPGERDRGGYLGPPPGR